MAKVISQLPSGGSVPKHNNLLGLNEGDYLHLTQSEKAKLDGIQSGAEVNVNADWNAISGDAQILNKPASFPPSTHTHTISEVINLQNELNSKENISNKVNTISGNSSTEYPTEKAVVDYVSSQIGADFAKVVYFDNVTPNVASIFDLNNPPLVNDPSLKEDVANLYIGTDASTWVYITSPAGYVTKTVTSSGSNFYITGTSTDAGSIKTSSITKKGQIVIDSEVVNDSGLTLKKTESSILKTDSLGKVVKATNLQDIEYAPIVHTHTVSQITDFPTFKTIEGQSVIGAGNIDLDKNSVGLGNVDNTSDLSKPLSTATQTALNNKENAFSKNTAFNKNFGLNSGDVVGANTLLNQYSTTPIEWTAMAFNSGQVVFFAGKQWISKIATVAGDVPAASSKWEEITFDALANKTVTVDQTIIDGSTNAVSSNGVFDGLALKANLASPALTGTPTAPTATAGTNTTQIATTAFVAGGLATKENAFSKNTAFNKNFGTTAGTVAEGNDSRINNGQTAFGWGNHAGLYPSLTGAGANGTWGININGNSQTSSALGEYNWNPTVKDNADFMFGRNAANEIAIISQLGVRNFLGLGSNAYTSTDYFKYETFTADANTLPENRSAFTYALNAPNNGPIAHFAANSYGMQMNMPYGDNGNAISLRSRNGDGSFWNPWRSMWHDGNFNPANYLSLTGAQTVAGVKTFSSSPIVPTAVNANEAVNKSQLDAVVSSGSYTPTLNSSANISSITGAKGMYTKIGNVVTCSIYCIATVTTIGATLLKLTKPIVTTVLNAIGSGTISKTGTGVYSSVYCAIDSNSIIISMNPTVTGDYSVSVTIQYLVN